MTAREYPARPIVGVGGVVLVLPADAHIPGVRLDAGCGVVLVRRGLEPLAGQWSLPGGVLDVGETLGAGLAREIAEETGLTVHVGPVIDVIDRIIVDPDRRVRFHFVLIDYLCRPTGGELRAGSDAEEVALAETGALESFNLAGDALSIIRRAVRMNP